MVTGSPWQGHSDSEGPQKHSRPITDPLVDDGVDRPHSALAIVSFCLDAWERGVMLELKTNTWRFQQL
ncbi:conserved hypothetical protein [Ricinus communis]|uniref:Uncharacterized protein n=1 Tax=Ricinus communis TaxID=3988 RepID=B9RRM8_RICCO|nr:conserved hypothetical protein [Ricinus communis]